MTASPDSLRGGLATAARWAATPRGLTFGLLAAFAAGLLLGWLLLGWWLAPPPPRDATPAELAPALRSLYIQTVADAYVRESDVARARLRLQGFSDAQLQATLGELANDPDQPSAVSRNNVNELARALAIDVAAPVAGATPLAPAGAEPAASLPGSPLQWLVLILLGLALAGAGAWLLRRNAHRGPSLAANGESPEAADEEAFPEPRGRGTAPPWRGGRMYLGDTITVRCRTSEESITQGYLVHNDRGVLVGSVYMKPQRIGSVATVDLWLVERDEDGAEADTPLVTFAARSAADDTVFRARLSDRHLVAAVPGARAVLEGSQVVVDIRVRTVEPDPASERLSLDILGLSLTPDGLAPSADAGNGTAAADSEPPIPLPFRPD